MGLKEDYDTLTTKFDSMEAANVLVAEDIGALKDEIVALNAQTGVDLTPLIARAEAIEAGMRAAAGSTPGSDA